MDSCGTCDRPLEPGYEFCHFCGTPVQQGVAEIETMPGEALTKAVGKAGELAASLQGLHRSVKATLHEILGEQHSLRRRVFYALACSATIILVFGFVPLSLGGLMTLVEMWLLLAVVLVVPISSWTIGASPFSSDSSIFGGEFSTRKRALLAGLMSLPLLPLVWFLSSLPSGFFTALSLVSGEDPTIGHSSFFPFVGFYMIMFYGMGYTVTWRNVIDLDSSLFYDDMAERVEDTCQQLGQRIRKLDIPDLSFTEVDMKDLKNWTDGESSGTQGRQMVLVSGRSRILLFVRDFGRGIFIRWSASYDASGRRFVVALNVLNQASEGFVWRWLGWDVSSYLAQLKHALSPVSKHRVVIAEERGGWFTRGVSEYAWNELYAFEAAVKNAVVGVIKDAVAGHVEESEIRSQITQHSRNESSVGSPPGAS